MIVVQKSAETKLMEMLGFIHNPDGWWAIHFHLDTLLEQYKSEYQFKIAINLIRDLLKGYEGGIYYMADHSIIVVCCDLEHNIMNKLIFQLRYLYMDDPVSYLDDGEENSDFCTIYNLSDNFQDFMDMCGKRMAFLVRRNSAAERAGNLAMSEESPRSVKRKFDVSSLAAVERDLQKADIQRVLRRQPVCAVSPDMSMRRIFEEMYINIMHLRQLLKTDVDFLSNRWLFKYMTQLLDNRMLELFRGNINRYTGSPVSLNLNVETIISSRFAKFDSMIKPSSKVAIVIEIPAIDVFVDINAFKVARDEAQRLGYRVCLDGVSVDSFLMVNSKKLGIDLVKMQWNADIEDDLNNTANLEISEAIRNFGSNRVILCRCDNKEAVQYGQALGISLFQGRYIDKIITPDLKIEN
ncbi:MAG: hypothetical protein R3D71_01815 [Rickettsiales bacterium]